MAEIGAPCEVGKWDERPAGLTARHHPSLDDSAERVKLLDENDLGDAQWRRKMTASSQKPIRLQTSLLSSLLQYSTDV